MLETGGLPGLRMIRVSIVEDDAKLRETLVRYFAGQPGFRCLSAYPNAEAALADSGRVVIRYSGTEALARVMIEAESEALMHHHANAIADAIRSELGV